ncbi:FAS1 domain-containing protein [Stipitochalara longipes BDJ]|nr:FAS1 domain-containing protein [Stipitochalara longipes BDJ]
MKLSLQLCILSFLSHSALVIRALSFVQAISAYPQLSNFTSLLNSNGGLAQPFYSFSYSAPQTVLVPDNNAFLAFQQSTGQSFASQPYDYIQSVINYQLLNGNLKSQDFLHPAGVSVPTGLTGPTYDNRTAGSALISSGASTGNHDGQVVFIAPNTTSTSFSPRQLGSTGAYVQSGLGHQVNLTAVDGVWDGGVFQIIDGFLTLPEVCTKTIQAWGLSSLDSSLNRTGLSSVLDHINNVTCLGPNDKAFLQAGSPDSKANVSALTSALTFHTIPQPLYSNFLQDGQTFTSLSNDTIRVTIQNGAYYFNDAKAIQLNVLTNNGLMHVLDRVMSPLDSTNANQSSTSSSPTATATSTAKPSPSATNKSSSASRALTFEPTGWRIFEVLGFVYSYIYLIF